MLFQMPFPLNTLKTGTLRSFCEGLSKTILEIQEHIMGYFSKDFTTQLTFKVGAI